MAQKDPYYRLLAQLTADPTLVKSKQFATFLTKIKNNQQQQCMSEGPTLEGKIEAFKAGVVLALMDKSNNPTTRFEIIKQLACDLNQYGSKVNCNNLVNEVYSQLRQQNHFLFGPNAGRHLSLNLSALRTTLQLTQPQTNEAETSRAPAFA